MLNRRHIRIKVLQLIYAFFHSESKDIKVCSQELKKSMEFTHLLYIHLILLLVNLKNIAQEKMEISKNKLLPSNKDMRQHGKFINNKILVLLSKNKLLIDKINTSGSFWNDDPEIQVKLLLQIQESKTYQKYLSDSETSFLADRKFVIDLFKEFIAPNENLHSFLEEKSIYWHDDFSIANLSVIKTLKSLKDMSKSNFKLLPIFKNEDDRKYAFNLLNLTLQNSSVYKKYIVETASNWDEERISDMDQLLMQMAITELLNFDSIPVKVTMNEYIELSKDYSSLKSKFFINGIIDKLVIRFKKEGKLIKLGRGLLE